MRTRPVLRIALLRLDESVRIATELAGRRTRRTCHQASPALQQVVDDHGAPLLYEWQQVLAGKHIDRDAETVTMRDPALEVDREETVVGAG